MASRDPDSPSTADLEYAAAIAERQYRQWREHERLHQSDAALPKARGRSRSPAPGRVASSLVETTPNSRGEGTSSECSDVRHQPHLSMTHCDPCGAPPLAQRGETVVRLLSRLSACSWMASLAPHALCRQALSSWCDLPGWRCRCPTVLHPWSVPQQKRLAPPALRLYLVGPRVQSAVQPLPHSAALWLGYTPASLVLSESDRLTVCLKSVLNELRARPPRPIACDSEANAPAPSSAPAVQGELATLNDADGGPGESSPSAPARLPPKAEVLIEGWWYTCGDCLGPPSRRHHRDHSRQPGAALLITQKSPLIGGRRGC